jgi:hypothetical protein
VTCTGETVRCHVVTCRKRAHSETERSAATAGRRYSRADKVEVMGSLSTLRRHWILTFLLLVVTLAGTAALGSRPGPYQAESQVVLLPSVKISKPNGDNPYLSFIDAITLTADLVRREVTDPRTALSLAAQGFPDSYQVVDDPQTAGPVLDVTVTGNNKTEVEQTLHAVTAQIRTRLADMQAGVKQSNRITSLVVSLDPRASLLISKKARTVVVALGLGLVLTIAIPQILDAALSRRRGLKRRSIAYADRDTPTPADDDHSLESSYSRDAGKPHPRVGAALRDRKERTKSGATGSPH